MIILIGFTIGNDIGIWTERGADVVQRRASERGADPVVGRPTHTGTRPCACCDRDAVHNCHQDSNGGLKLDAERDCPHLHDQSMLKLMH